MNIDDMLQDLAMMQISDSFFPTGLYASSNGLESIFQNNKKITHLEVGRVIETQLKQQIGPTDLIVMENALKFASAKEFDKILELDMKINSIKNIKEFREASKRSGIQLVRCVREFIKDEVIEEYLKFHNTAMISGAYPVSFGLCANALGIGPQKAGLMFLYGFTVSVVGAASRMGITQHYQNQKIIHELKPLISQIVRECIDKSTKEIWQFMPHLEILQMRHERMDSKMFIT
jgi:urease accessory protein